MNNSGFNKEFSIAEAYEIVSGYKKVDDTTFAQALKVLESDNSDFAKLLLAMYRKGTSFSQVKDVDAFAKNLETASQTLANENLKEELKKDKDIATLSQNTKFVDDNGGDFSDEAQGDTQEKVIEAGIFMTAVEIAQSDHQVEADEVVAEAKKNVVNSFVEVRTGYDQEEREQATKEENTSFFKKWFGNFRRASNFKEEIKVSGRRVVNFIENVKSKSLSSLEKLSKKANASKTKALWNKVKNRAAVYAAVILTTGSIASSCNQNGNNNQQTSEKVSVLADSTNRQTLTIQEDNTDIAPEIEVEETKAEFNVDSIVMPTEWADSMSISKVAFAATQKFDDNSFTQQVDDSTTIAGSEYAYKRLAAHILENNPDLTPEQLADTTYLALNAHRYLRSNYPNPEKLEQLGIKDSTIVDAATKAKELDQFLNGCDENVPENLDLMFIEQVPGNKHVFATGIESPCDDGNVQYKNVKIRKAPKINAPVQEEKIEVSADTVDVADNFVDTESFNVDTLKVEKIVVPTGMTYNKSNEGFTDSKVLRDADQSEVASAQTENQKILMEGSTTKVDAEQEDFVDVDDASLTATSVQNSDSTNVAASDSVSTTIDVTSNFVASQTTAENADTVSTATATSQTVFSSSTLDVTADSVEVLANSDSIPLGTPAAGYVNERGGHNNSGLTEAQINHSRKVITNKYGKDAYDDMMVAIQDEWLAKGGIFEGLTREEAIYMTAAWAVYAPNDKTPKAILNYTIGCYEGEVMPEDVAAEIKADVDLVRQNNTIEGKPYNRNVFVRKVKYNGCDEKITLDMLRTKKAKARVGGGAEFPRFFARPIRQEGFVDTESFSVDTITVEKYVAPNDITYNKSNEGFTNSKKLRDADYSEVASAKVKDQKILIETASTGTKKKAANQRKADKKRAKRKNAFTPAQPAYMRFKATNIK